MALTSFDLTLEGTLHEGTTSEDSAVARAIIGVDELLTSAARALYGYLGDPEVDVRRKEAPVPTKLILVSDPISAWRAVRRCPASPNLKNRSLLPSCALWDGSYRIWPNPPRPMWKKER